LKQYYSPALDLFLGVPAIAFLREIVTLIIPALELEEGV